MKELKTIIEHYNEAQKNRKSCVLASLIRLTGSGYRRPGAHMLVTEDAETTGTVIGACLERDLVEHCLQIMRQPNEAPKLIQYDTSHDDDEILGSGSGCTGQIQILIEHLNHDDDDNTIQLYKKGLESADLASKEDLELSISMVSTVEHRIEIEKNIFTVSLKRSLIETTRYNDVHANTDSKFDEQSIASEAIAHQKPVTRHKLCGEKFIQHFAEPLQATKKLIIFGAGHDAETLVHQSAHLGYEVEVYDHRRAQANSRRFPEARLVQHCQYENKDAFPQISANCYCILMTHNFLVDKQILSSLLNTKAAYIGLLGPQRRGDRLLKQLQDEGTEINSSLLKRIHSPIGLNLGAETPEQIALSILAELQALAANKPAGFLRDTDTPIHDSPVQSELELKSSSSRIDSANVCQA